MASMQDAAFFCIPEEKMPASKVDIYCGLCLSSATLGLAGAAWQIHQWKPLLHGYKYRRKPSPNPMIVFSLAVANLLACIGVMCRATTMMLTPSPVLSGEGNWWVPLDGNLGLVVLGTVIEACSQYFYGVTFMWTMMYAIDVYMQVSYRDISARWYHVVSWAVPGVTTLGSVLAISISGALPNRCPTGWSLIIRYLFDYILIIVTTFTCPVFYFLSNRLMRQRLHESGLVSSHSRSVMSALQHKFLAMVVLFTICWLPNLVDGILHIVMAAVDMPPADAAKFFPIWALEAVLNPLQGLLMSLVYGRHVLYRRILMADDKIQESTPILYRSGKYT